MKNVSNPIYRVLIAMVIIVVLILAVVLLGPKPKSEVQKVEKGSIGVVTKTADLYEKGSRNSMVIKELPAGTRLTLIKANGTMYNVETDDNGEGWVEAENVKVQPKENK